MNARIQKLIGQCTFIYDDLVYDGTDSYMKTTEYFDKEKFAELIVRECAGVCDDERDSTDSDFGKLVAEGCALKIMERFGVEE